MSDTVNVEIEITLSDLVAAYVNAGRWSETGEAWKVHRTQVVIDQSTQKLHITVTADPPTGYEDDHHHD